MVRKNVSCPTKQPETRARNWLIIVLRLLTPPPPPKKKKVQTDRHIQMCFGQVSSLLFYCSKSPTLIRSTTKFIAASKHSKLCLYFYALCSKLQSSTREKATSQSATPCLKLNHRHCIVVIACTLQLSVVDVHYVNHRSCVLFQF